MRLSREKLLWLTFLLVSLILLLGSDEQRVMKANFLGQTIYLPWTSSLNIINEIFELRERNRILTEKLADRILRANSLEDELYTLQSIVQFQENFYFESIQPQGFMVASVVAHRGNFNNRLLLIDKGKTDGMEVDFPVISEDGVVGKILNVFQNHSVVLPISNPQFKLGVITQKSRVQGLLEADFYGKNYMNMIRTGSQVNVGDIIETSSVSILFPRGFPVGTISRLIKTPEEVYMRAEVTPYSSINDLEQVIVLYFHKDIPDEE